MFYFIFIAVISKQLGICDLPESYKPSSPVSLNFIKYIIAPRGEELYPINIVPNDSQPFEGWDKCCLIKYECSSYFGEPTYHHICTCGLYSNTITYKYEVYGKTMQTNIHNIINMLRDGNFYS